MDMENTQTGSVRDMVPWPDCDMNIAADAAALTSNTAAATTAMDTVTTTTATPKSPPLTPPPPPPTTPLYFALCQIFSTEILMADQDFEPLATYRKPIPTGMKMLTIG